MITSYLSPGLVAISTVFSYSSIGKVTPKAQIKLFTIISIGLKRCEILVI